MPARSRPLILVAASALALAACDMRGAEPRGDAETETTARADSDYGYETFGDDNLADTMASDDARYLRASQSADGASGLGGTDADFPDAKARPVMQAQVVLDRVGFGPGVIDGEMGISTSNALSGFQEANDLAVTGELDEGTKEALARWERIPATRVVTVPQSWASATYGAIPEEPAQKAEMERLGYSSIDERLAERFHTTVEVLRSLNPNGRPAGSPQSGAAASPTPSASATDANPPPTKRPGDGYFKAGQQIRVPNIGGDRIAPGAVEDRNWQQTLASLGVGTEQPEVDRIVVSKAGKTLRAYQGEKLVALFTVSSGSSEFPLPIGEWDIVGKAFNPDYSYDPEVLGNTDTDDGKEYRFPPGPNGPVGVVWIDLSKEHYGIHGTPDPETIGRAQSSGCVRLTNWDAARLAGMVSQSTRVIFEA